MSAAVAPLLPAFVAAGTAHAATPAPAVSSPRHSTGRGDSLEPLINLLAQRLKTADAVSTAKYGTPSPVDDPAREKTELDSAAAMATQRGLDPNTTRKIFSDQIQANKVVQYGLYSRWTARPNEVPETKADLSELRTRLDTITDELIRDLVATKTIRSSSACRARLRSTQRSVSSANHFDALHVEAFNRALISVCT